MKKSFYFSAILLIIIISCAAPVKILTPAKHSLGQYKNLEITQFQNEVIGDINESVMEDIMIEAIEDIVELNHFEMVSIPTYLFSESLDYDEEESSKIVNVKDLEAIPATVAILKVSLISYDEGNAFLRFLFGALAGSGKVTCQLNVIDKTTNEDVIVAETTAKITGAFSGAENVVGPLSKAIVNFVEDNFIQ